MKAVVHTRYGPPERLAVRDVPRPEPGPGEVLVRVRAASVHPDIWHVVAGRPWVLRLMGAGLARPRDPIPGTDMAGVVESVGDGVTRFRPGDAVFGETMLTMQWRNGGAYAEYVAVPEQLLAAKPDAVTFEEAASVPTAGHIALLNLPGGPERYAGRRVLINGAGGGVGSVALQVLKAWGAHVTAVDLGRKLEMLRTLGADDVVDYTRDDFTRRGRRYHLIFDIPGNRSLRHLRRALEPDGRYVLIAHDAFGATGNRVLGSGIPRFLRILVVSRWVKPLRPATGSTPGRPESIVLLRDLLATGRLTPVIDSVYPLAETPAAIRHMMEDELMGKVVVAP